MHRSATAAMLLTAACITTPPAPPSVDLSSGIPSCAGMAVWELPDYPVRIPAPSGAIVTEGGVDASGGVKVTLKALGTPQEIAAFYQCALPYVGNVDIAAFHGGAGGFTYAGPGGARGRVVLRVYDLPFPDDGWDTFISISETPG